MAAASCRILRRAGLTVGRGSRRGDVSKSRSLSLAVILSLGLLGRPATQAGEPPAAASPLAVCESTGFEAVEPGGCGWETGWICGSTFTNCAGPPIAQSCTGDPVVDGDCCMDNPNPLNGWYVSRSNQHCHQPHISTENPASGTQHLRFSPGLDGGTPPGCRGLGTSCRQTVFTPSVGPQPIGPTTISFDLDLVYEPGPLDGGFAFRFFTVTDSAPQTIGVRLDIYSLGDYADVFIIDPETGTNSHSWEFPEWSDYLHVTINLDPCVNEITHFVDGQLVASHEFGVAPLTVERAVFASGNYRTMHWDIDNYSVTRHGPCPTAVCGNGVVDDGEDCEPGVDEACCPGRCGVDCLCARPHEMCGDPRPLTNGVNGPFLTDGGMYSYAADTPFTSIETCGTTYDSVLHWDLFNNCAESVLLNDECGPLGPELGQDPGDPSASCFDPDGFPTGNDACLCSPTVPGNTYEFLVDEYGGDGRPAVCGNTLITITKKTACGQPIEGGACCDRLTGLCTQAPDVTACTGPHRVYSENKTCDLVVCEAITGACCDRLPGNCAETLHGECTCPECTWSEGLSCGTVACTPTLGACCERDIDFAECSQTSLPQCDALGGEWTRETDCAFVECDPSFSTIPTISQWGLVVLTLLVAIGGKLAFARPAYRAERD